jgi:hypothetical protein
MRGAIRASALWPQSGFVGESVIFLRQVSHQDALLLVRHRGRKAAHLLRPFALMFLVFQS